MHGSIPRAICQVSPRNPQQLYCAKPTRSAVLNHASKMITCKTITATEPSLRTRKLLCSYLIAHQYDRLLGPGEHRVPKFCQEPTAARHVDSVTEMLRLLCCHCCDNVRLYEVHGDSGPEIRCSYVLSERTLESESKFPSLSSDSVSGIKSQIDRNSLWPETSARDIVISDRVPSQPSIWFAFESLDPFLLPIVQILSHQPLRTELACHPSRSAVGVSEVDISYVVFLALIAKNSPSRISLDALFPVRTLEAELESFFLTELPNFAIITLVT